MSELSGELSVVFGDAIPDGSSEGAAVTGEMIAWPVGVKELPYWAGRGPAVGVHGVPFDRIRHALVEVFMRREDEEVVNEGRWWLVYSTPTEADGPQIDLVPAGWRMFPQISYVTLRTSGTSRSGKRWKRSLTILDSPFPHGEDWRAMAYDDPMGAMEAICRVWGEREAVPPGILLDRFGDILGAAPRNRWTDGDTM